MRSDCQRQVANCQQCIFSKRSYRTTPPLVTTNAGGPLELVCMDLIKMKRSTTGHEYALVLLDHFSKFAVTAPLGDKSADSVGRAFVEKFILNYGCPKKIYSDRGTEFLNSTSEAVSRIIGISQNFTLGHDPSANGATERLNKTIKSVINKHTMFANVREWDELLPYVTYGYNITPHDSTLYPPHKIFFGRDPILTDCPDTERPLIHLDEDSYLQDFRESWADIITTAKENLDAANQKMKAAHDKIKRPIVRVKEGDRVLVTPPSDQKNVKTNYGPYRITKLSEHSTSAFLKPEQTQKKGKEKEVQIPIERIVKIGEAPILTGKYRKIGAKELFPISVRNVNNKSNNQKKPVSFCKTGTLIFI